MVFLATVSSISQAQILKTDNPWLAHDKMIHFTYSMTLTAASVQLLDAKRINHCEIKAAALVFGAGVAKEFLMDRKASYLDITVDFAGCVGGILLNMLIMKTDKKRHAKQRSNSLSFFNP
jgi:uncharacterized protein YfiM (DUF2279 family)